MTTDEILDEMQDAGAERRDAMIDRLRSEIAALRDHADRADRERSEWQDRFIRLTTELGALMGTIKRLTRERDEAIRSSGPTYGPLGGWAEPYGAI